MRTIPLTKGEVAIVDDDDFDDVARFRWAFTPNGYASRAVRIDGKWTHEYMHRRIAKTASGMQTDHVNGNRLDNRKKNLREATKSQNECNVSRRADNTAGHKGVDFDKRRNQYRARIELSGKRKHIGYFLTAEEAAEAYQLSARELHGQFARY